MAALISQCVFAREIQGGVGVRQSLRMSSGQEDRTNELSFKTRQLQPELMDQPDIDQALHRDALRGLARINWMSQSGRILWRPIFELAQRDRRSPQRPWRLLDIACGGGDVTIDLWRRAAAAGVPLSIVACDVSQTAVDQARQAASTLSAEICFIRRDGLTELPLGAYDIVTSSLFLHHLNFKQAVQLLQNMANATRELLLVNDLIRSRGGYVAAWFACRVLTRSPVVRIDGPRSVAGAFTIPEVKNLCERVPMPGARISRCWPFRFLLEWRRQRGL